MRKAQRPPKVLLMGCADKMMPTQRDWVATLDLEQRKVRAFDLLTLDPLFEGAYIPPDDYEDTDPRQWSDELMNSLREQYGIHGGTLYNDVLFVLMEVEVMRMLRAGLPDEGKRLFDELPLRDALEQGRQVWTDFWNAQTNGGDRHA